MIAAWPRPWVAGIPLNRSSNLKIKLMDQLPHSAILLDSWCREAIKAFGDDWPRIKEHIDAKLTSLCETDRLRIYDEIARMLATDRGITPPNPAH